MAKKQDEFVSFLHTQIDKAKKFTEKFIERNKRDVELYEGKHVITPSSVVDAGGDIVSVYNTSLEQRYSVVDRLIFTNTESAKSAIFDQTPELIFKARNKEATAKEQIVKGVYEYLKDKLELRDFANDALHWFVLSGETTAYIGYKSEFYDAQAYDEGEPIFDELGEPVTYRKAVYDDPTVSVCDPKKTYYAPASKHSIDMSEVPYNVKVDSMDVDLIRKTYGIKVEADVEEEEEEEDIKDKTSNLATIYFYTGRIPANQKDYVEDWDPTAEYYVILTKKKILLQERRKRRQSKRAKWYSHPNQFFGFGFGKIGEPYQLVKEQRRGQLHRAADVMAFAKLAVKNDGEEKLNPEEWKDPRENLVVPYTSQKPEYLTPPTVGDAVLKDLEQTESDAQAAFGLLDLSAGAQESTTTQTATGQTIFADAAQKRLKYGKGIFMSFYRQVVIEIFKQCQENWEEKKIITITDENGETAEVRVGKEELMDIDFDKDIDIDPESITANKDIIREQMIALYDKVKDDPLVDRKKVFADMVRMGFGVANPDKYIKEASEVEPGTVLIEPQTGQQYIVGEGGEVVSQEVQAEMGQPGVRTAQTQQGLMGNVGV